MFRLRILHGIVKYLLLIVLSLSSNCLAAVKTVQNWGDDDDVIYYFTTRWPSNWDKYQKESPGGDNTDRTIFFVVLAFGIVVIAIIVAYCYKQSQSESGTSHTISGATVHPPSGGVRFTRTSASPTMTNIRFPDDRGVSVSFINSTYHGSGYPSSTSHGSHVQVDHASDKPPDYATVTISDLGGASRSSSFPPVVRSPEDTPPPKYEDGL